MSKESERKRAAALARKKSRRWVTDNGGPRGGYWYAVTVAASEHGTWNTYNNWYCRCYSCTAANAIKQDEYVKGTP